MAKQERIFKGKGIHLSTERAERYSLELIRLRQGSGESMKTKDVVESARSEDSPLHDFFMWDDTKAAELYRRVQARHLVSGLVEVIIEENEEKEIPIFYNVIEENEDNGSQGYVMHEEVGRNGEYRDQLLQKAVQEIKHWQAKYKTLKDLDLIFGAIEKVQKKLDLKQ